MATEAQLAANRANAQHSTGPKTSEGKAAAALNHLKFGLTGQFSVQPWENQEEFDQLVAKLNAEHQPTPGFETDLVFKMAQHFWLSQRALLLQEMCFDVAYPACHPVQEKQLALYLRYQTTHERAFERCSNELRKRRNETRQVQIGFESQKRKEAEEVRKQANETRKQAAETRHEELHPYAVLLAEAKIDYQKALTSNAELPALLAKLDEEDRLKALKAA